MQTKSKLTKPLKYIKDIIYVNTVESTQDVAKELAGESCPANTLIIAGSQTKGRGRLEKNWYSPQGGLYFSLILKPKAFFDNLADLNIKAAEAVSETSKYLYNIKTKIKPPNDVLAYHPKREQFLKIAGILIESSSTVKKTSHWIVLGIGINLNNELSDELKNATSVKKILKREVSLDEFLNAFFDIFWTYYGQWEIKANLQTK